MTFILVVGVHTFLDYDYKTFGFWPYSLGLLKVLRWLRSYDISCSRYFTVIKIQGLIEAFFVYIYRMFRRLKTSNDKFSEGRLKMFEHKQSFT